MWQGNFISNNEEFFLRELCFFHMLGDSETTDLCEVDGSV